MLHCLVRDLNCAAAVALINLSFAYIICYTESSPTLQQFMCDTDAFCHVSVCNDDGEPGGAVIRVGTGQGSLGKGGEWFFSFLLLPPLPPPFSSSSPWSSTLVEG